MILAAADFADGKTKVAPRELTLLWNCDRFEALPKAGGLLDQPYGLMLRMRMCENVHGAMQLWKASKWETFEREHPAEWDIVQQVMSLREEEKDHD